MKIVGFSITKYSAERKKAPEGKIDLSSGINIDEIEKQSADFSEKPILKFGFTFLINYLPDFATIEIKGHILALDDKGDAEKILEDWKNKKFDHPVKIGLLNFLLEKCSVKSLVFEEEFGLPLHVPFPKISSENQIEPPSEKKEKKSKSKTSLANYAG